MKQINLGKTNIVVPVIITGCMRIGTMTKHDAESHLRAAIDAGAIYFDHADCYGSGACETRFGEALNMTASLRDKIFIQTKCGINRPGGIKPGYYDFSKEHILEAVDGSLKRMKIEYLDALLLHRPDTLMEPEEVASAFDTLYTAGKVRNFGVSNMGAIQIMLLQKYIHQPIQINQLQVSLVKANIISNGLNINGIDEASIDRDGGILEFCRLNDITIQTWSPFQYGYFQGTYLNNDKFPELNNMINVLAKKYNVTNTAIVTAWLSRHPANLQVVVGTTNSNRLKECIVGTEINLSRQEWYDLYMAAGNKIL
jgi:predicted oxidoreductase